MRLLIFHRRSQHWSISPTPMRIYRGVLVCVLTQRANFNLNPQLSLLSPFY